MKLTSRNWIWLLIVLALLATITGEALYIASREAELNSYRNQIREARQLHDK
jgi:hypothetical protein